MRFLELLGLQNKIKEVVETIKLDGPFLQEDYILKNKHKYIDLLCKTITKCNLILSRDLLVLCSDNDLSSRDNSRIEVGIDHHIHQLELSFTSNKEYEILAIDRFVILNPSDALILKDYINHHLPTCQELKNINSHI